MTRFARFVPPLLAALGFAGLFAASQFSVSAQNGEYRLVAPFVASDHVQIIPPPTPTPQPTPYQGAVSALYLPSAQLNGQYVIERRHTVIDGGRERFQDPSLPQRIAWYDRFGQPGTRAGNALFAAHVDYYNYGDGPFHDLVDTNVGDTLTIVMDNGIEYYYTVQSVGVISLDNLDMNAIVYPPLASNRERITLISCGGTFVSYPGGGGEYLSRVILVAERYIP